jgi:REP-associated tyrosine transposase
MPRAPRHFLPGATYHVILRGNNGQPIFSTNEDRCRFCLLLQQGVEQFGHRIIAFCFMTNHVHLAVRVDEVPLSQIFHNLTFRYTQFFNRKHGRYGHLFQGRYKSILVDSERYLQALIRYIHLNPVQASLVDYPQEYRWSSHRAYLMETQHTWLSTELGLECFSGSRVSPAKMLHNFVMAGIGAKEIVNFDRGVTNGILGDDEFVERLIERKAPERLESDLPTLLYVVSQYYSVETAMLQTPKQDTKTARLRAITALLARKTTGVTLSDVARFFRQDRSSVSKACSRLEAKMLTSPSLRKEVESLIHDMNNLSTCHA